MKLIISSIIALLFLSLIGCGTQKSDHDAARRRQLVYTGEIISVEENENSLLTLRVTNVKEELKAVGDMVLKVTAEKLKDGKDSVRVGNRIKFVLVEKALMTKSYPPIVFLESLIEISLLGS